MTPQAAPSYAASPLGSFPELSQMYATNFSSPLSNAQAGAQASQDKVSVSNAAQAAQNAKDVAAAFADKSKYTIQQRSDGGFGFYGPDGKEVTAAQYALNTNQKLSDVLKDSNNPIDQRYIQDIKDLNAYSNAKAQSSFDNKSKATSQKYEELVKNAYGLDLSKLNPVQISNSLKQNYPTIYGANQGNAPGFTGSNLFLPTNRQVGQEVKQQYPTGFGNFGSTTGGSGNGVQ